MTITTTDPRMPTVAGNHAGTPENRAGNTVFWGTNDILKADAPYAVSGPSGTQLNGLTNWLVALSYGTSVPSGKITEIVATVHARVTAGEAKIALGALRVHHAYDMFPVRGRKVLSIPLTREFADYEVRWPASTLLELSAPTDEQLRAAVNSADFGVAFAIEGKGARIDVDTIKLAVAVDDGAIVVPEPEPEPSDIAKLEEMLATLNAALSAVTGLAKDVRDLEMQLATLATSVADVTGKLSTYLEGKVPPPPPAA